MRGKHDLHLAIAIKVGLQPSVLSESRTAESPDTDKGRKRLVSRLMAGVRRSHPRTPRLGGETCKQASLTKDPPLCSNFVACESGSLPGFPKGKWSFVLDGKVDSKS